MQHGGFCAFTPRTLSITGLVAVVATCPLGCTYSGGLAPRQTIAPAQVSLPEPEEHVPSQESVALAEQATRDVAQLQTLGTDFDRPDRSPLPPPPKPVIQWNGPVSQAEQQGTQPPLPIPETRRPAKPEPKEAVEAEGVSEPEPVLISATLDPSETTAEVDADLAAGPVELEPGALGPDHARRDQLVVDLSRVLYQEAAYSSHPLRELLVIASTAILDPERALDAEAIPGLTDREREILTAFQGFFGDLGVRLSESADPDVAVAAAAGLNEALATGPRLAVTRAVLCTRVGGYGDYDEFGHSEQGRYSFLAHSGQQAVVYVELEDFTSRLNENGLWVTELAQQLVVYSDRDGIPVQRVEWQAAVDTTKNKRDDFFLVQVVTLAERLSVGRYQLKIRVRDETSGAETETALEFQMVADPSMAAVTP
jgi:hypothetical protein